MKTEMIISLTISILASLGTLYTYIVHTRRLNSQQKLINSYQLKKIQEEEAHKKQARIEASISQNNSSWRMEICNVGEAEATNISFESPDIDTDSSIQLYSSPNQFPYPSLLPKGRITIPLILCEGHKHLYRVKFTWEDEYSRHRSHEQDVNL